MRNTSLQFRSIRGAVVLLSMLVGWSAQPGTALAETAQEIFTTRCSACHTIGSGKLIGPDLSGVTERRPQEWILSFVKGSQAMVQGGDETAVALFAEFNQVPMPDQPDLTEAQILAVLELTKGGGVAGAAPPATAPAVVPEPTQADIELGQALFQGTARLENSGPTCNSCHDVVNDAVIGGGVLARELTTVFGRLGGPGVRAILGSPPFPVMQKAYEDRPLTEDEVGALVAFLQASDRDKALQQPRDYGPKLAATGGLGAAVLLGLYTMFWRSRRRTSVNQSIYDRQITSSN